MWNLNSIIFSSDSGSVSISNHCKCNSNDPLDFQRLRRKLLIHCVVYQCSCRLPVQGYVFNFLRILCSVSSISYKSQVVTSISSADLDVRYFASDTLFSSLPPMRQQVKASIEILTLAPLIQVEKEGAIDEHNHDVSPIKKKVPRIKTPAKSDHEWKTCIYSVVSSVILSIAFNKNLLFL